MASPEDDPEWWRDHFSGLMLDLWGAIVPPERAAGDAAFLERKLGLQAGARVLDVPCGDGRVAIVLAGRGFRMTGIDISPGMIAAARDGAAAQGVSVDLREGEMRDLPDDGSFDAAYCWGDSFGYMDDAANAAFLDSVRGALRPDGLFALEVQMLAEVLERRFAESDSGMAGDISVAIRRGWDRATGRLTVNYDLERDGTTESSWTSYRVYALGELILMLTAAGFVIEECGDETGRAFTPDRRQAPESLRVVCRAVTG